LLFVVPSTETSVMFGAGSFAFVKNCVTSVWVQPPPSSMIAMTPPPGAFVGQS
jgi:hypothetical protein